MGWTKRQFFEKAFSKLGMAGYVFDLSPEQMQDALSDLDSMMGFWNSKGIQLGFPISPTQLNSDLDEDTGVQIEANEAIYLNLAVRIAPSYGKGVTPELKSGAKQAYDNLMSMFAMPRERQMPGTMPAGAGNKPWRFNEDPFLAPPNDDPLLVEPNGQLTFVGN